MDDTELDLISMTDAMWQYDLSPHELNYLFMKGILTRYPPPNKDAGPGIGVIDRGELEAHLQQDGRRRKR